MLFFLARKCLSHRSWMFGILRSFDGKFQKGHLIDFLDKMCNPTLGEFYKMFLFFTEI